MRCPRRAGRSPGWPERDTPTTSPRATTRHPRGRVARARPPVASRAAPGSTRGRAAPGRRDATRAPACTRSRAGGTQKAPPAPTPVRTGWHTTVRRPAGTGRRATVRPRQSALMGAGRRPRVRPPACCWPVGRTYRGAPGRGPGARRRSGVLGWLSYHLSRGPDRLFALWRGTVGGPSAIGDAWGQRAGACLVAAGAADDNGL